MDGTRYQFCRMSKSQILKLTLTITCSQYLPTAGEFGVTRPSYDLDLIDLKQIVSDYRCQNDPPLPSILFLMRVYSMTFHKEKTLGQTLAPGVDLQFDRK